MSNRIYFKQTEFRNLETGKSEFGFLAYDSYGATFGMFEGSCQTEIDGFVKQLIEVSNYDETLSEMIYHIVKSESSFYINDTQYPSTTISQFIPKES